VNLDWDSLAMWAADDVGEPFLDVTTGQVRYFDVDESQPDTELLDLVAARASHIVPLPRATPPIQQGWRAAYAIFIRDPRLRQELGRSVQRDDPHAYHLAVVRAGRYRPFNYFLELQAWATVERFVESLALDAEPPRWRAEVPLMDGLWRGAELEGDEAIRHHQRLAADHPDDRLGQLHLGLVLARHGRSEAALRNLARGLELGLGMTDHFEAALVGGICACEVGRPDRALAFLDDLRPPERDGDFSVCALRAIALLELGRKREAMAHLNGERGYMWRESEEWFPRVHALCNRVGRASRPS
jgi:tetratricopeptide (TPR) repeat protein